MRIATDIGGTFTDLVAVHENGKTIFEKSHTTPPDFEEGVINVIEKSGISPQEITDFIHGTTTIINALTEQSHPFVLVTGEFRNYAINIH